MVPDVCHRDQSLNQFITNHEKQGNLDPDLHPNQWVKAVLKEIAQHEALLGETEESIGAYATLMSCCKRISYE